MENRYVLRTYQGLFLFLFKLFDLAILFGAGLGALWLVGFPLWPSDAAPKGILLIAGFCFFWLAQVFSLYQPWRGKSLRAELVTLTSISTLTVVTVAILAFVFQFFDPLFPQLGWYVQWLGLTVSFLCLVRMILRPGLKLLRSHGANQRNVVFVGMSPEGDEYIREIQRHPEFGFRFLGYVDDRDRPRTKDFQTSLKYLGPTQDLPALCEAHSVDQIWFGYPIGAWHRLANSFKELKHFPVVMRQLLNLQPNLQFCNSITGILGTPLLDLDMNFNDRYFGNFLKAVQDKLMAGLILVLISPLLLGIAVAVKVSSPGPVLYRQTRLTWRNKTFEMLKFRSMPVNAEQDSGPQWARQGDSRATKVGAFLRATSLDELPQFWNVLRGDMSIVGPRPERPEFVEDFKHKVPNYMKKHRVKAGITGWAQINGLRGNTDLNKRIEYDLYYIRNGSIWFDLKIIFLTLFKGFFNKNAY